MKSEIRLIMVGTDSWEKGEQLARERALERLHGAAHAGRRRYASRTWWQNFYQGDQHGEHRDRVDRASTGSTPATKNTRLGENRFLRALYYFNLVRTYGAVQLDTLEPTQGVSVPGASHAAERFGLLEGDHSRSRVRDREPAGEGSPDRLLPRHEGRGADAARRGVPDARGDG